MKKTIFFSLIFGIANIMFATPIPQEDYTIAFVSSDSPSRPAADAFDGDPSTFWAIWNGGGYSLPAIIEVGLGGTYDVDGFSYTPNPALTERKAVGYELYLSMDGIEWGDAEVVGNFIWEDIDDVSQKDIFFGAVTANYVKVVYTTNNSDDTDNTHTGELVFHESEVGATGQENQIITFESISKKSTEADPITLSATASSGLTEMSFTVVSGPASVSGSTLTLDGIAGLVTVKVEQLGNVDYYAAETSQQFIVIDLSTYYPEVSTRLTEAYSLQMPSLYAYPIYINSAIDEPDFLSVDHIEISVDGVSVPVDDTEGYSYGLWTPEDYGTYTVNIKAVGTNGNETTITRNIEVTDDISSMNAETMDEVVIQYGGENSRWYYGSYTMPQHIGSYDQIIANLLIECPTETGNCDDWDRWAHIDVMGPDGNWIQIIRYITPYGVGCSHTLDVTDYANLLQGDIEFRMFIDTWGTGGWQISLDFDHEAGTPEYLYSTVDELWDGSWDLGDPSNLQPVDPVSYSFGANILRSHLRLSTTGHGWGANNSENAAEFYEATNFIDIDGVENYEQHLWNDCDPNPDACTGQLGTWRYSRAGWCPGAISPPNIVDMTSQIPNGTIEYTYRFDPTYTDFCHPNNPDCVTGLTCDDCDDTFRARYEIDGQLINFSNSPLIQGTVGLDAIDNTLEYQLTAYPNPSSGKFQIFTDQEIGASVLELFTINGEALKVYYFESATALNNNSFDLSEYPAGIYFVSVQNNMGQGVLKLIIQ